MNRLPFTHRMLAQIIEGNKTETRRTRFKKYQPGQWVLASCNYWRPKVDGALLPLSVSQYGQIVSLLDHVIEVAKVGKVHVPQHPSQWKCCPSIHMPSWLCQCALQIVETRSESLEAIDDTGARAEGFADRGEFMRYFECLNPGAKADQVVQVIRFTAHTMQEAHKAGALESLIVRSGNIEGHDQVPEWLRAALWRNL